MVSYVLSILQGTILICHCIGSFVFDIEKDKSSLEARVSDAKTGLGTEEDALFVSFLRSAMQLDPNRRGRPRELAKHPWLVGKS